MGFLEYQINEIMTFLEREEKRFSVAFANSPEGTLHRTGSGKHINYVHCIPDPNTKGKYSRRQIKYDNQLIQALAAKEYARRALRQIARNRHFAEQLSRHIKDIDQAHLIGTMKSAYRSLPSSCFDTILQDPEHLERQRKWASRPYRMSDYKPGERNKSTSRGLLVRSKSEVMLSEKLYEFDIPFRYEQVIEVGSYELSPDFTFLDRHGREFYLEYCGLMDDFDYVDHYIWKRRMYESIGITEWRNMIYVYEENNRIHLPQIEDVIRTRILPRL